MTDETLFSIPMIAATLCTAVTGDTSLPSLAGVIPTSSFTVVDGGALPTTDGDDFISFIIRANDFSFLSVKVLQ